MPACAQCSRARSYVASARSKSLSTMRQTAMLCSATPMPPHPDTAGAGCTPARTLERLDQTILTMKNVGDVDVQPGEAAIVAERLENLARPIGGRQGARILAEQDQRLDRGAERPGDLRAIAGDVEQRDRLVEQVHRGREVVAETSARSPWREAPARSRLGCRAARDQNSGVR